MRRVTAIAAVMTLVAACGYGRAASSPQPAAGSYTEAEMRVRLGSDDRTLKAARVSAEFFPSMNAAPLLGRNFAGQEFVAPPQVVILSHSLWTTDFKADPTIIGQRIEVDGRPTVVVGIMPKGLSVPEGTMLWIPRAGP